MELIEQKIADRYILRLIRAWLKAGIFDEGFHFTIIMITTTINIISKPGIPMPPGIVTSVSFEKPDSPASSTKHVSKIQSLIVIYWIKTEKFRECNILI